MNCRPLPIFSKQKLGLALLLISIPFCVALNVRTIRGLETTHVSNELSAAADELQKSPPGTERGERFLKRLEAINPGYAPAEVKRALADYIAATREVLTAMEAGDDSTAYGQGANAMAKKKQELLDAIARDR